MVNDYLECNAVGTISSPLSILNQKNNKKMVTFKFNISIFNERVTVKLFGLDEAQANEFKEAFTIGDKIKVKGSVKCDAFISKERLVKGITIVPTEVELLEKSTLQSSELKIISTVSK